MFSNSSLLFASALVLAAQLATVASQGHNHTGHEDHPCQCEAKEQGWAIDCSDQKPMTAAYTFLGDAANKCGTESKEARPACETNYLIVQAHHDHCNHDDLPKFMEEGVHTYEKLYKACVIHRKYDDHLPECVKTTASAETVAAAVKKLEELKCDTLCNVTGCPEAFQALYYAHETIENDEADIALHKYEEACEHQGCNTGSKDAKLDMKVCEEDHKDDHKNTTAKTSVTVDSAVAKAAAEAAAKAYTDAGCDKDAAKTGCAELKKAKDAADAAAGITTAAPIVTTTATYSGASQLTTSVVAVFAGAIVATAQLF